jgi:hypothetical protein
MACALNPPPTAVSLDTSGAVEPDARDYATAQVMQVARDARVEVHVASLQLRIDEGQALAVAKARLQTADCAVRAHVVGATAKEAVDRATARLRVQLATMGQSPVVPRAGRSQERRGWAFGVCPTARPEYAHRCAADCSITRRKTYDRAPCTRETAIERAALLEYDFYVFVDANTRRPAVVRRDGKFWQVANPAHCGVTDAIQLLGVSNARFVFFVDVTSALHALYRRYDGNYGLLSPEG